MPDAPDHRYDLPPGLEGAALERYKGRVRALRVAMQERAPEQNANLVGWACHEVMRQEVERERDRRRPVSEPSVLGGPHDDRVSYTL